ncbi:S1C family serine protease [Thermodesulfobacteriota bacterium]
MMSVRILILIAWSLFIADGLAYSALSFPDFAENFSPSVVSIIALDENDQERSFGSGFFIDANGLIVTSHHVLAGCSEAIVRTPGGQEGRVIEIKADSPELDLLVARTSLRNTKPLVLGDSDSITVGEEIICLGNPAGLEGAISAGIISGIKMSGGIKLIQTTAPITPGISGGPLLRATGKVVGIATAFLGHGRNIHLAMPSNYLRTLSSTHLKPGSLPKERIKIEAVIREKNYAEILDIHYRGTEESPILDPLPLGSPGVVFFKSGKRLLCDRAWKNGETIFLNIHGKQFAIAYDEKEIDMKRSFKLPRQTR